MLTMLPTAHDLWQILTRRNWTFRSALSPTTCFLQFIWQSMAARTDDLDLGYATGGECLLWIPENSWDNINNKQSSKEHIIKCLHRLRQASKKRVCAICSIANFVEGPVHFTQSRVIYLSFMRWDYPHCKYCCTSENSMLTWFEKCKKYISMVFQKLENFNNK